MNGIQKIAKEILASKYIKGYEKFYTQGNEGATALEGILHKYDFSIDDLPNKLRKLALAVAKESFMKSDTQSNLNEIEKFLLQPKTFKGV